jgi:undecaprenyl-diphosphatase
VRQPTPASNALGLILTAQLAVLVMLGAVFGTVFDNVTENEELTSLDPAVSSALIGTRQPWLNQFFEVITWAGSGAVLFPLVLAAGLTLHHLSRDWQPLILLTVSLGAALTVSTVIKLAVARPRPSVPTLVHAVGYAFPSGHSTAAAAGWLGLALVLGTLTQRRPRKVALVCAALVIAGLVGVSRIYLGVHELTDVLAGWSLGAFWVLAVAVVLRLLDSRPVRDRDGRQD